MDDESYNFLLDPVFAQHPRTYRRQDGSLDKLFEEWHRLLLKKKFTDLQVFFGKTPGKFLSLHRIVLASCSPVISSLIKDQDEAVLILPNIHYEDFLSLIQLLYTGRSYSSPSKELLTTLGIPNKKFSQIPTPWSMDSGIDPEYASYEFHRTSRVNKAERNILYAPNEESFQDKFQEDGNDTGDEDTVIMSIPEFRSDIEAEFQCPLVCKSEKTASWSSEEESPDEWTSDEEQQRWSDDEGENKNVNHDSMERQKEEIEHQSPSSKYVKIIPKNDIHLMTSNNSGS